MYLQHIIHPALHLTPPHATEPFTRFFNPPAGVRGRPGGMVGADEDEGIQLVPFGEVVGVLVGDGGEDWGGGVEEEDDGCDALEECFCSGVALVVSVCGFYDVRGLDGGLDRMKMESQERMEGMGGGDLWKDLKNGRRIFLDRWVDTEGKASWRKGREIKQTYRGCLRYEQSLLRESRRP